MTPKPLSSFLTMTWPPRIPPRHPDHETVGMMVALIKDLKQRRLLDTTLEDWGGGFRRTPMGQINRLDEAAGGDHRSSAFSIWLAGGGIQGGRTVGESDEFGLEILKDPIHVNALQATTLHCLGFDRELLTCDHAGRKFRLTDVEGHVVAKLAFGRPQQVHQGQIQRSESLSCRRHCSIRRLALSY